jgi:hypothetical protein
MRTRSTTWGSSIVMAWAWSGRGQVAAVEPRGCCERDAVSAGIVADMESASANAEEDTRRASSYEERGPAGKGCRGRGRRDRSRAQARPRVRGPLIRNRRSGWTCTKSPSMSLQRPAAADPTEVAQGRRRWCVSPQAKRRQRLARALQADAEEECRSALLRPT